MGFQFRKAVSAILAICLSAVLLTAWAEETDVKSLQKRLLTLGFEIGDADGIWGNKTASAVMLARSLLAEKEPGLSSDGLSEAKIAELIMQEENSDLLRTLLRGSWGARVREAQQKLIGLNLLQGSADGKYGADTESAVTAFEELMDGKIPDLIMRDGRLSTEEFSLLMSDLSVWNIEAPVCFDDSRPEALKETYLYAKHAFLINAVTGEPLLEKAADEQAEPASTTKIVTLLTALSMCDPEAVVVIPDTAADVPKDSTLVPVAPGETMTMRDLLYAMIIRSGNDAANAVAALCSGSVESFTDQMNRTAAELGMKNSRFVNPHGYTAEGHYTTARDLVTAARYGLTQTLFREIVTCLKYTLPPTEKRGILPLTLKWEIFDPGSGYYIPHAAGVKSGYTSTAGFCYVGAYQENGITLIAAVLGGRTRNMAWTDLRRLFAYGMAVSE